MEIIITNLKNENDRSYDILVENGLLALVPELLKKNPIGKKHAVISDDNVSDLYGEKLVQALKDKNLEAHLLTFPAGDESKKMSIVEEILNNMSGHGFTREDAVIALGGGVTGDIAGFAASIYLRGIPFIQIPTTLLAMTDSSIGGKTGVNLRAGKNLAGTFYQPKTVYIDPEVLKTLPHRVFLDGISEVVKYGVIYDKELFETIENYKEELKDGIKKSIPDIIHKLIVRSCEIKAEIVEKDERESGLRRILNYGHTIGHAIETSSKYEVSHGQAIAMGMVLINTICANKGLLDHAAAERINNLIRDLDLINAENESYISKENTDKIWTTMLSDKKVSSGKITFMIPTEIGKVIPSTKITIEDLRQCLK